MSDLLEREIVVFNTAVQLPAADRAGYLEAACAGDLALRGRVEALLEAELKAGAFLEEPPLPATLLPQASNARAPGKGLPSRAALAEGPGDHIGRYKLLQQIGEGGCGIVYMAEQEEPVRRRVALKIIKLGMDTKSVIARFEAERQALALMDHPNIARVLDAGATETGRPFFVMELVRGIKLTEYCDQNSLSTRERLELFILVCKAVQHAHQKGIIHRDLKPSNILVTVNDGAAVPKVIDFGIAKATEGRLTDRTLFTAFEQFIGTPAYMSPEQSIMTSVDIDTRSDIYSLGVLLYELLTAQTPFEQKELLAAGLEEMRQIIREKEPLRPSTRLSTMGQADLKAVARRRQSEPPKLVSLVRGDLDWIVMKCLEKDRARRYDTANGLAMDVQRLLANEPVVARPPSRAYRLRKLVRRHKLVFLACGGVLAALLAGLSVSTWEFLAKSQAEREQHRLRDEAQKAQVSEARSRRRAEASELAARKKAYASDMALLRLALAADDLGRAQELLNRQRAPPGQSDIRGWEWRYYWQFCQTDAAFTLCQRSDAIVTVSFSADGALLAVGSRSGEVTVWEIATRRLICRHPESSVGAGRVGFAPASQLLAFDHGTNDQAGVVLWPRLSVNEMRWLPLKADMRQLAFSRDGRLFTADLGRSNNVTIWDTESGRALHRFSAGLAGSGMGTVFAITQDGGRVAHAVQGAVRSVRVVDVNSGGAFTLSVTDELTTALAFSPDGGMLITGGGYADSAIKLWNVTNRQFIGSLEGHRSWISCLKFLPDGRTLASASADRTARLWDVETRRLIRTLRGNRSELWTVDVSPDGRWVASGCKDGSVIVWDLTAAANRAPPYHTLPEAGISSWSPSSDGSRFAILHRGRARLFEGSRRPVELPAIGLTNLLGLSFLPGTERMAVTDRRGRLSIWDVAGRRMVTNFLAHPAAAYVLGAVSKDGQLITRDQRNTAKVWDTRSWKEVRQFQCHSNMLSSAVASESGLVATGCQDGTVELGLPEQWENRQRIAAQPFLASISLSRSGAILTAANENGTLELWDTKTLRRTALLHGVLLGYHSAAISHDGQRVAGGSTGQEAIKLWDPESHEEVATLPGLGSFFHDAKFSPAGDALGALNWNGVLHLWTAPSWTEIEAAEARGSGQLP